MKKRNISIFLVLIMLFSIGVSGPVAYAQYADVPDMDAPGQEDSIENTEQGNTPDTPEDEDMQNPPAQGGEDESKTDTDGDKPPAQTEDSETEFDETKPFTMSMLDEADDVDTYEMDMETIGIPLDKFIIEAQDNNGGHGDCELDFPEGLKEIKVGELANNVPALISDTAHGSEHAYAYAHVRNTEVFYVGHLTVHDGNKTEEYTVYTTDKHIDKRTVYVVLQKGETIKLVYKHGTYHTVDYQFQNMDETIIPEGREESPWTYDKIFGHDRVRSVASGENFNGAVTIPRGYKAKVLVKDKDGKDLHEPMELGKMMTYKWDKNARNTITPDPDNVNAQKFRASYTFEDVKTDITVIVKYEKIKSFNFNAYFWSQTNYAANINTSNNTISSNRISITTPTKDETPSETNCKLTFGGEQENDGDKNSFTWNFKGITSGGATWEMDQLEINGEPITVPMVSIEDQGPATAKTTLSTGTVITLTVTSLGGSNGSTAKRAYTLKAENCYEDLTVSNGNMVGHSHKEFATRALIGVKDTEYWHGVNTNTATGWWPLKQNTLLAKTKDEHWQGFDTFRMKPADGYGKLNVTFTDKESNVLQTNDEALENGTKNNYIEYLIRTDNSNEKKTYGEYKTVTYDKWVPSADGYYYCKANNKDNKLRNFMNSANKNGVVLLWFYAESQKYGIDYQNGAKEDGSAPNAEDIDNFPPYQDGGEDGYNLLDNTKALVSNLIPVDKKGKFVFDHWEILTVENGTLTGKPKEDKEKNTYKLEAGGSLPLSKEALDELHDCLYYNTKYGRNTLTLRAVWRSAKGKAPIPYTVNYYITEIQNGNIVSKTLLEGHQHMANEGATLVADLWQDENKTLSPIITEILKGDNDYKEDYTKEGTVQYIIYEPSTIKKLENISLTKNVVDIYLVKQPNLTVGKTVTGEYGDLTQQFTFTITLTGKNEATKEVISPNGTYNYTGGTVENVNGVTAPAGGTLTFENGQAKIDLSHGQQITFTNLPFGCDYTVTENPASDYTPTYSDNATGVLESDQTVSVVNTKGEIPVTGITDDTKKFQMLLLIGTVALLLPVAVRVRRIRRKI